MQLRHLARAPNDTPTYIIRKDRKLLLPHEQKESARRPYKTRGRHYYPLRIASFGSRCTGCRSSRLGPPNVEPFNLICETRNFRFRDLTSVALSAEVLLLSVQVSFSLRENKSSWRFLVRKKKWGESLLKCEPIL